MKIIFYDTMIYDIFFRTHSVSQNVVFDRKGLSENFYSLYAK